MRVIGGMEYYTFEEILDEDLGPIGTPERDAFHAAVKADVAAELEAERQKQACKEATQDAPHRQHRSHKQLDLASIPTELQLS